MKITRLVLAVFVVCIYVGKSDATLQFTGSSSVVNLNGKPLIKDGQLVAVEQLHEIEAAPEKSESGVPQPRTFGTIVNIITFIPRTILRFVDAIFQILMLSVQTAVGAKFFAVRLVSTIVNNVGIYLRRVFQILFGIVF